ncbi:ABC transporter permease [Longimicrobium terrae]|uniref:Putative ABC transport system permease protein n=1 Tax=Longimicrobium terrae TaxID=1639882 RepID=A0A841GN27_9BACT|nr:ABC transporter permease [Longimicrobium terrae]MBB4635815.1 putative ABC transport system permease protein [Longimicrobium terrae]MBB6070211.1 putative ABC transport system permease protein [Longimicrobium terrae]NNC30717.1 ABC transporter permease [Longimicrobium terrae]
MNWTAGREGVTIALESLRANKVRASLTILGIVIGVATVMTMAAAISGFRGSVMSSLESIGPKNFIVARFDQTTLQLGDGNGKPPWDGKPAITFSEAQMLAELPSIRSVSSSAGTNGKAKAGSRTIPGVQIGGQSADWPEYSQGDFVQGRNYLPLDEARSNSVAVLSLGLAEALFPGGNAVGREVRLAGQPFRVVGVYKVKDNIFASSADNTAYVPTTTAIKRLGADPDWMSLLVVPATDATQAQAMDEVTSALRISRGLRPGEENNFALMRQEAFGELFDRITGVFFLVMLVLAGIGLIVGGVGVVGIMMISVTERTREIGVRKALGATPREILWQFLVESMTVTLVGGVIGLLIAMGFAGLITALTPVPASIPLWAVGASLLVAAIGGMGFGLYPAFKAARLDPVDALRYE